jgi:hypothetical protein
MRRREEENKKKREEEEERGERRKRVSTRAAVDVSCGHEQGFLRMKNSLFVGRLVSGGE